MIKILAREFADDEALAQFLEELVANGEDAMKRCASTLLYEEMLDTWGDAVDEAIKDGYVEPFVSERFHQALLKNLNKPYPEEAVKRTIEEMGV